MIWIMSSAHWPGGCAASSLIGSSNTTRSPEYSGSSELRQLLDPDAMAGDADSDRRSRCVWGVGGKESSVDDARHELTVRRLGLRTLSAAPWLPPDELELEPDRRVSTLSGLPATANRRLIR